MTRIATILIAAGVLLVPVSLAGADTLPKDAVKRAYKVPHSYPLNAMTKKGLPVSVTCDGDTTVSSLVDVTGKLGRDRDDAHRTASPGSRCRRTRRFLLARPR